MSVQKQTEQAYRELSHRLRASRPELEQAILDRIDAVVGLSTSVDPTYAEGLRATVSAALDHALTVLDRGERRSPFPIPGALLSQTRLAVTNGVGLDTVLRRYLVGHSVLVDVFIAEAERAGVGHATQHRVLRRLSVLFDEVVAAVSEEHVRQADTIILSSERRRAECIERLLDGEPLDASELNYDLNAHHLGVVASGSEAARALRGLARTLDRSLLIVPREDETVWAWLGGRHPLDPDDLVRHASQWSGSIALAVGEPGEGAAAWRLTHRQAVASLTVALQADDNFVRYRDVALLALALQDDLLATSLHQLYLVPLAAERDGGQVVRETLRAFFSAGRNASSAAAALGVNRHTVTSRLHVIEKRLQCRLPSRFADFETALQLDEMDHPVSLARRNSPFPMR